MIKKHIIEEMKNVGTISVDMDSISTVYESITNKKVPNNDVLYTKILPRFLLFFKKNNIKATFFIIGSQIKSNKHKRLLRSIVKQGHELANHTQNHLFNFSKLSYEKKEEEIALCEDAIKEATGIKPVGFRAPGWDIDSQTLQILENRGYLYDSSIFPSLFLFAIVPYIALRNKKLPHVKSVGRPEYGFAPLKPYHPDKKKIWKKGKMKIWEFPISATPFLRIPFFGSFLFSTKSKLLFDISYWLIKHRIPLNYELHAIELYSKYNIPKILRNINHPSLNLSFKKKMTWYNFIMNRFKTDYKLVVTKEVIKHYENNIRKAW